MNTTEAKQDLLGRFRNVATVAHSEAGDSTSSRLGPYRARGRRLITCAEALFFDEARHSSAAIGSVRYDGAISLSTGPTIRTSRNTCAGQSYVSVNTDRAGCHRAVRGC